MKHVKKGQGISIQSVSIYCVSWVAAHVCSPCAQATCAQAVPFVSNVGRKHSTGSIWEQMAF